MTTLLDILYDADAIEIDDHFIRYFGLNTDNEAEDGYILEVEINDDIEPMVCFFTSEELESAIHIAETNEWAVTHNGETEPYMFTGYMLRTIGDDA